MEGDRLRFKLELERNADPIEGRLRREHGQTIAFAGWLELIAALEEAQRDAPDRPAPQEAAS